MYARGLMRKKKNEEMEDIICLFVSIIEESHGNDILVHHLLVFLLSVQGTMKNLKSELDTRLLHPSHNMPHFVGNEDDMGMSLKQIRDFLNNR